MDSNFLLKYLDVRFAGELAEAPVKHKGMVVTMSRDTGCDGMPIFQDVMENLNTQLKSFILNIPDNFSNGAMFNVPIDEFVSNIDNALENGFTVTLDCDVSESTFSSKQGVAIIPENDDNKKIAVLGPEPEKSISQSYRQDEFENYDTTDDHLMHITGKAKDQNENIYYKVKNSWGTDPDRTKYDGYVYMSVPYIKLKAISVLMHKDGLVKNTVKKMH